MTGDVSICALLPAGGRSSRMGEPKLLLPLAGQTVLEHVIAVLHVGGIERILVVAAPHLPELATVAEKAGAAVVVLPADTPDMRATIEHGLRWIEQTWAPAADDAWFLVPADHPVLEPAVIRDLSLALANAQHSIFVPTFEGKRGHPVVFRWSHVNGIRAFPPERGLNQYIRAHAAETLEVPVAFAGILRDLDTPADYQRLIAERGT